MDLKQIAKKSLVPGVSALIGGAVVAAVMSLNMGGHSTSTAQNAGTGKLHSVSKQKENLFDASQAVEENLKKQFDSFLDERFFGSKNPFDDFQTLRSQFENRMQDIGGEAVSLSEVSQREDDSYVYYDLKVADAKATSIQTKVEEGYISISGTTEKGSTGETDDETRMTNHFVASFRRTFPLPGNVDPRRMQIVTEEDKITLKFPKLKS